MDAQIRPYDHDNDFERVNRFLIEEYQPGGTFTNWLQPRWEYMLFPPYIREVPLEAIGVADAGGEIVGIANIEHSPAFGYFQVRPGWEAIKPDLFAHANKHFGGWSRSLERDVVGLYIHEMDETLTALAQSAGFVEQPAYNERHSRFDLTGEIEIPCAPYGFRIQSLEDENDLVKIDRCLHRGFNHAGEPPANGPADRAFMQSAPNFRKDLTVVAVSPRGDYVSFGGMWVVPENRVGYVEPVATDPDYRMMGLGRLVVLESMRRAAAAGAEVAWVGSDLPFYAALGFEVMFQWRLWVRDR